MPRPNAKWTHRQRHYLVERYHQLRPEGDGHQPDAREVLECFHIICREIEADPLLRTGDDRIVDGPLKDAGYGHGEWRRLKGLYWQVRQLREFDGFLWDENTQRIVAADEMWELLDLTNPSHPNRPRFHHIRTHIFPFFNQLHQRYNQDPLPQDSRYKQLVIHDPNIVINAAGGVAPPPIPQIADATPAVANPPTAIPAVANLPAAAAAMAPQAHEEIATAGIAPPVGAAEAGVPVVVGAPAQQADPDPAGTQPQYLPATSRLRKRNTREDDSEVGTAGNATAYPYGSEATHEAESYYSVDSDDLEIPRGKHFKLEDADSAGDGQHNAEWDLLMESMDPNAPRQPLVASSSKGKGKEASGSESEEDAVELHAKHIPSAAVFVSTETVAFTPADIKRLVNFFYGTDQARQELRVNVASLYMYHRQKRESTEATNVLRTALVAMKPLP